MLRSAVVAVDLRRAAVDRQRGDVAQHHRAARAGHGQARQQLEVGARVGLELHHHRHLALRQVQLGQALVVVAGGGDAQRVGDGRRGHAQVGGAREVGPHDQLRAHQAGGGGDVADAGDGAQLALHLARMLGQHAAVLAGQHQDVLLRRAAEADLDARAGQRLQRDAQLRFDGLLAQAAALLARRHVDRQRGLAHLGRALWRERVAAGAAAADGGVDQLDVRVLLHQRARVLGGGEGLREGAARRQRQRHLRLRQVVRRDEAGGQQRHQHQRADEEGQRAASVVLMRCFRHQRAQPM